MRRDTRGLVALVAVLLVALTACTRDSQDTTEAPPAPQQDVAAPTPPAAGEMALAQRCEAGAAGLVLHYPAGWHAAGSSDQPCERFDPGPLADGAEPAGAAIRVELADSSVAEVAEVAGEELTRALATVAGQPAVRLVTLSGEGGTQPPGTRSIVYLVDLSEVRGEPSTLVASTSDTEGFAFEEHRLVLDAMMRDIEVTDAPEGSDSVVLASREGGTRITVRGTVQGSDVCLVVDPPGEPACGIPGLPPDGVTVTSLPGSTPEVVGGTAARTADRVEVRRDGRVVTVLPVRLMGHAVWAAPVGGTGEIEVTALAADGAELGRAEATAP